MALNPSLLADYNTQINAERANAAVYLASANRLEFLNLTGLARFMRDSSADELTHAQKFTDYVIDRGGEVVTSALPMPAIPAVGDMLSAGAAMFGAALALEQQNTERIKSLYMSALEANDTQSLGMLQWFLDEQTRSERELVELVARLTLARSDSAAVLALDHEIGEGEK